MATIQASASAPTVTSLNLKDSRGIVHSSAELRRAQATVFLFLATDCPISNSYAPELARIYDAYNTRKVQFFSVYADPSESAAAVSRHAAEFHLLFTALLDPEGRLASQIGATATPEAAVVSPDGRVLYRGRIDDRYYDYGKARANVERHDLRAAIDEILAGRPVSTALTKVLGCAIPGIRQ